jgi:adenylate kinase family enzyme
MFQLHPSFPKVIILYGPPAAGKGTQTEFLKEHLPNYFHIDFGTEIRNFIKIHKESDKKDDNYKLAQKMELLMQTGPVEFEDLKFVVEKKIIEAVKQGKGLIIEGPGRQITEAHWLSKFLHENGLSVAIFHLHLNLEDIVARVKTRFYAPNNNHPFSSYEDALKACKAGEIPYQRKEDVDVEKTISRYRNLYKKSFAKILFIYQLEAKAEIFAIDASESIEMVRNSIFNILKKFYSPV